MFGWTVSGAKLGNACVSVGLWYIGAPVGTPSSSSCGVTFAM
jgi:hypothetical protein